MIQVFEKLIQTTIICSFGICLLLFLKRYLFKNFSKKFNYYIWLIIVFRMLLFLFNYTISYEIKESESDILINNINQINISTNNNFILYLTYLWILVAVVITAYTFMKYKRFKNFVVDLSYDIENSDANCIYKDLLKELNIKKNIHLRGSDELISPAGMGLFKSYIFLPDYPYSKDELHWVLRHELMHFKNKDILIKFIVMFVKLVHWFNPLVYVMSNRINLDCELCCDESVLDGCRLKEKKEYALVLIKSIKLSKNYQSGVLTTEFNKTNLEKRLNSIVKKKGRSGIFICILVSIISIISFVEVDAQIKVDKNSDEVTRKNTEVIKNNPNDQFQTFLYKDAPPEIRKIYEEKCKANGIVPKDFDSIEIPTKYYNKLKK